MLSFFDPIYRGNSTKSQNWMRCAWNSISYPYAHIYVEFVLCVVGFLTLWSQWVWAPFCLWCCSRNNWRCIGCSAHSQGRCCHHVLIGVKLGWSQWTTIYYIQVVSTTSFQCYLGNKYQLHAYISCIQPCVGCIMAWFSWFVLVILVSFLKASQQWSLVASCDVFDVCVCGVHWYTIRQY